jgi:hypothetical protein
VPGAAAVAVICLAGALQLRPIPAADLNHLVSEVTDPTSAQTCATSSQVRYCLYPGFGRQLPALEAPVGAVLARLPARPAQPLTVRQVAGLSFPDATFTHGQPGQLVTRWTARLRRAPGNASAAPASAIYLPVGTWPAAGGQLAEARFALALAAADWAVGLDGDGSPAGFAQCVPLGQAREAIAIWLAILAARPPAGDLQDGLGTGNSIYTANVGGSLIRTWASPGLGVSPPGGGPQDTAAGYLLAQAMAARPAPQVSHVVAGAWGRWLSGRTTDAQLAAALGIPSRSFSAPVLTPAGRTAGPGIAPQSPRCPT